MTTLDILSASAGPADIQEMLQGSSTVALLQRMLSELLPPQAVIEQFEIYRAKFKPDQHLRAYYRLHLAINGSRSTWPINVAWIPPGGQAPYGSAADVAAMHAEILQRGSGGPFRRWCASVEDQGMYLYIAPLDVTFPQLARLYDRSYADQMLRAAGIASQQEHVHAVIPLRYRPAERHVLRYDLLRGAARQPQEQRFFAKIYNSAKGADVSQLAARLADWLEDNTTTIRCVRPVAYLEADRTVLYPEASGVPLSELLSQPGQQTYAYLARAGAALATLHRVPETLVELRPYNLQMELAGVTSATKHVRSLLPSLAGMIDAIVAGAQALDARLAPEAPSFAYGDFKADHTWLTHDLLTLVDCDTCYYCDPALDIGKYLADLRWWYAVYENAEPEQAQQHFLAGYSRSSAITPERMQRCALYEALFLLKITARRAPLYSASWASLTERLVRQSAALLEALSRSL